MPDGREDKYTPPARRAPTGSSTVKGAPIDPAIISSRFKPNKPQASAKSADDANVATASTDAAQPAEPTATSSTEARSQTTADLANQPSNEEVAAQNSTPLKPPTTTSRAISPQAKDGTAAPNATATVERDVLVSFKAFANQQRTVAEKARSTKARADKEVKLTELKKFASNFKLPTPVPVDLIGIIAKDPAKQKAIQEKAARDAVECQRRKAEEKATQEKKSPVTSKDGQPSTTSQGASNEKARPAAAPTSTQPTAGTQRHPGARQNFVPQPYQQYRNGAQHMGQAGVRQGPGLAARIQNQKMGDMRPPTGPAHSIDPSYLRRPVVPVHLGNKLNPNSHEFRPSPFAAAFNPNGHPSAGSSPRSALNNTADPNGATSNTTTITFITRKKTAPKPEKCDIFSNLKAQPKPEGKNWSDNDGVKPSFDTPPSWRQVRDDEKPESTMHLKYTEYFERQPFATQPTPNPSHVLPQLAHQHQLPFHLQQGAQRGSPQVPPVPMHPGQHVPMPHGPYNGADDNRMMQTNSQQSYASPRVGPITAVYTPNMTSVAPSPYNQNGMPFMGGNTQQMGNHFNRSFSNQTYMSSQMQMGVPPPFGNHQGMPNAQIPMYPPGPQYMPPGGVAPQPIPGANGYPSPGRAAAPMMVHNGSQQGQPMYGISPGMPYSQPVYPPQPGQGMMIPLHDNT